jgi:hypothetical protein
VAFGLLAPLSAQAGGHGGNGGGSDKPWICHPVNGKGENGAGWNVINPNAHSSHINEQSGAGKHTRKDGRTDMYASGGKDCGQGYPKPTHTKTHHPKPTCTTTTHHPKPTHTKPYPTTTTTVTESVTTPATVTSTTTTTATETTTTTTTAPAPESPATNPPTVAPSQPPAEAATQPPAAAPVAAPVAQAPQQAAVVQNVVPKAATDGADLQPQTAGLTGLQPVLIGAGLLLLLAAGLLSARRTPTD